MLNYIVYHIIPNECICILPGLFSETNLSMMKLVCSVAKLEWISNFNEVIADDWDYEKLHTRMSSHFLLMEEKNQWQNIIKNGC